MSAIAGTVAFDRRPDAGARCAAMLAAQARYATDIAPPWDDGDVALGRGLYAILPEDRFDVGPVVMDGHVLVADVRLDNRGELIEALGLTRGAAAQMPDAALLMRCLLRWGEAALDRLVGDYALALWSSADRRLLLARDPLGQKPLVYHASERFFAFASMPSGLHALPDVPRGADPETVTSFLAMLPEYPGASFFTGVRKVRAGHRLTVDAGGLDERRWWNPATEPLRLRSDAAYAEGLRAVLDTAVAAGMRGADAGVATHLSAGLDSSAVTATAARLLEGVGGTGGGGKGGGVVAYTSVPQPAWDAAPLGYGLYDEGPLAAAVASLYPGIEHVCLHGGGSPLGPIGRAAEHAQRPILNPCNGLWLDAILADAQQRGIRVLLSGQCGNLAFSYDGLPTLREIMLGGRLPTLARSIAALLRGGMRPGKIVRQLLPIAGVRALDRGRGRATDLSETSLLHPALIAGGMRDGAALQRAIRDAGGAPGGLRLWALQRFDLGSMNKGALGAWGIDLRDPTTDRRLIEFCLRVPPEQFLAGGRSRSLARRALADRLPPALLDERRKGVQGADWYLGMAAAQSAIAAEVDAIGRTPGADGLFDMPRMRALARGHPGDWQAPGVATTYRAAFLRALSAGHFLRMAGGAAT